MTAGQITFQDTPEETRRNFNSLVEKSTHTLIKIASNPLLSLSTVEVIVDIEQVTVHYKEFFGSHEIIGIPIKDISSVIVDTGPFFATLKIIGVRPGTETTHMVENLRKDDATKTRRIIQGLIVANKQEMDITVFEPEELTEKLETLGQVQAIE